ncbi:MAG: aspartyl/asparaginyl beta-hydroxylase domain-containing protein [Caulobacter sp.]
MTALQRQDGVGALDLLARAEANAPDNPEILLNKALAQRVAGDLTGALGTLDRLLTLDPYHFVALLSKGALIERLYGAKQAAPTYRNVLKIAPAGAALPPALAAPLARARQVVEESAAQMADFLAQRTAAVRARHGGEEAARFDEALQVLAGRQKVYVSEPVDFHYPRLPAIPFFDRSNFPWFAELEAATGMIVEELEGALAAADQDFAPYIDYPAGAPLNQWAELNRSRRWRSLWLWRDGQRQEAACRQCPRTAELLARLPMCFQPGFAPTALFSALEPHTHIPPHTGSTNARLLVHLPLILPGPARFRVGNEVREWRMGEAWAFDDTIEHEAWNDADALRVILIFDIWNPLLSDVERDLISEMMLARNAFYGAGGGPT